MLEGPTRISSDGRRLVQRSETTPLSVKTFAVIIFDDLSPQRSRASLRLLVSPGVAYPKSRRWGVSRSRWSQSRSLFALPGSSIFPLGGVLPRRECGSVLAVVKAGALRVAFGQP